MAQSTTKKHWIAGFLMGAGLALFMMYVLSLMIPINMEERNTRTAISIVALVLAGVGGVFRDYLKRAAAKTEA